MNVSAQTMHEIMRRRVARYAAAQDLVRVQREHVAALEAKLAEAKAELSQAELVLSAAQSRAYRAHCEADRRARFVGQANARMAEINELADLMRDSAEVNQALMVLAREGV